MGQSALGLDQGPSVSGRICSSRMPLTLKSIYYILTGHKTISCRGQTSGDNLHGSVHSICSNNKHVRAPPVDVLSFGESNSETK